MGDGLKNLEQSISKALAHRHAQLEKGYHVTESPRVVLQHASKDTRQGKLKHGEHRELVGGVGTTFQGSVDSMT